MTEYMAPADIAISFQQVELLLVDCCLCMLTVQANSLKPTKWKENMLFIAKVC